MTFNARFWCLPLAVLLMPVLVTAIALAQANTASSKGEDLNRQFQAAVAQYDAGHFPEAAAQLEKLLQEVPESFEAHELAGMVYAAQGKRAEALRVIKELEQRSGKSLSGAYLIARIYATLNEQELALAWLERGLEAGVISLFYKDAPVWDTIRHDPRFAALLRRMGVPV